jgi:heme/copper-type cytochrome/quinol oxidase subunit 2
VINGTCIPSTQPPGLEYRSQIFLVLGLTLYAYLPAIIILILNGSIAYKLVTLRRSSGPTASHSPSHSKTTVMLLCIAVAFVVLVTPNATSHLVMLRMKKNIF